MADKTGSIFGKILRGRIGGLGAMLRLEDGSREGFNVPNNGEPVSFSTFAGLLADAARRVTLPAASEIGSIENKGVGGAFDPVTAADRQAELAMRALIETHLPDHGIQGEELEARPSKGRYCWSLDPIDGTRAFICGLPSWTTLIALLQDGTPLVGLIDAPMVGERYLGADGTARLASGKRSRPLATSGCRTLAEARLSTTDPFLFAPKEASAFERLRKAVRLTRYGYDAYGYARLAAGGIDLVAETGLKPHDWQALVPVVRGAGGMIGNWRGGEDLSGGDILAAATKELFDKARELLQGN